MRIGTGDGADRHGSQYKNRKQNDKNQGGKIQLHIYDFMFQMAGILQLRLGYVLFNHCAKVNKSLCSALNDDPAQALIIDELYLISEQNSFYL